MMNLFSLFNDEPVKAVVDAIAMLVPGILTALVFITTIVIIVKVQKSQMAIEDSVSWVVWNIFFIITMFALLWGPSKAVLKQIADHMGFQSPILVVILWVIMFMFTKIVSLNIKLSKTNTKLNQSIQEMALFKKELETRKDDNKNQ